MFDSIKRYCETLIHEFDSIPAERKILLEKLANYISEKKKNNQTVNLIFICTHNSRRSHFGQIWAKVAGDYFQIKNLNTFSGGTEATAFHPNAIDALKRVGFRIEETTNDKNPVYHVFHSDNNAPSLCFSKIYDHPDNPQKNFATIMTCSDAEENCPFIPGVELRIATTYDDPKIFDDTSQQNEKYDERCKQIASEILYVFSKVN